MGIDTHLPIFYFDGETWKLRRSGWRDGGEIVSFSGVFRNVLSCKWNLDLALITTEIIFHIRESGKQVSNPVPYFVSSYLYLSLAPQELPSPLVCSSFLCSFLHSFLAHRMAELTQPSTFCRSCFVPVIEQVCICCLPHASTVIGARKTAVNKADNKENRNPLPLSCIGGLSGKGLRGIVPWAEIWAMEGVSPGENTWKGVLQPQGTAQCKGYEQSISSVHSRKRKEFAEPFLGSSHPHMKATCSC